MCSSSSSSSNTAWGCHKNLALHMPVHAQVHIAQTTTIQVDFSNQILSLKLGQKTLVTVTQT